MNNLGMNAEEIKFPMIGYARHRLAIDGRGITTLVAAHGCPLKCAMCLNPQSRQKNAPIRPISLQALYELVRIDDLYFQATGGGITFGGGEPLLQAAFICAFRTICGQAWRLTVETCLNVQAQLLRLAMESVDDFIVDIKDVNPTIYSQYTGTSNEQVLKNLCLLLDTVGPERVLVRVPNIPGYNTPLDIQKSVAALQMLGVTHLDIFQYKRVI